MNKNLILAITSAIIICSCGGDTGTITTQMSEEESQRMYSENAVVNSTLIYAYRISREYSQSVPSSFTSATVTGEYGTVTFSGTSSEANDRINLYLSSRFSNFGSWLGKITEYNGSDTISLDKNTRQLLEYRTSLQSCTMNYLTGTGSFIGSIHFNPITVSKQTDTTETITVPYKIKGLLQASSYDWKLDENKTLMTTFKK